MSDKAQILIVNPEPNSMSLIGSMLHSLGHEIVEAQNDPAAVKRIEREPVDIVISWADPDDSDCLELLSYIRRKQPHIPVLLIFSKIHQERNREAMRMGASAVLRYPIPPNEIRASVIQALQDRRPQTASTPAPATTSMTMPQVSPTPQAPQTQPPKSFRVYEPQADSHPNKPNGSMQTTARPMPVVIENRVETPVYAEPRYAGPEMIGEDPGLKLAIEMIPSIAARSTPVLIEGERGTGKSMLAQVLHHQSPNARNAFIEVNCSNLGDAMLERELFGHRVGSSNDASAIRPGAVALAAGGTIYLDDVAALSSTLQAELLQVLTNGEYRPVGSNQSLKCNVRFILSTRQDLSGLVAEGRIRPDLYYRIGVVRLKLPPLKHRSGDIERLAQFFTSKFSREFDKPIMGITPEAIELLKKHEWPGNVEELETAIQRGVALCQSSRVGPADLIHSLGRTDSHLNVRPPSIPSRPHLPMNIRPLKEALEEPEKQIIVAALQALNWNRQETARVLDINRTTLYKKMKKYGLLIDEPAWIE